MTKPPPAKESEEKASAEEAPAKPSLAEDWSSTAEETLFADDVAAEQECEETAQPQPDPYAGTDFKTWPYMGKLAAVVRGVMEGKSNKEIADEHGTSENMVKNYLRHIYDITGIYAGTRRVALAEMAERFEEGEKSEETPDQGWKLATPLTERESEVIPLVTQKKSNKEIAAELYISEQTVRRHISNIMDKLGVDSRLQVAITYRKIMRLEERKRQDEISAECAAVANNPVPALAPTP